MGQYEPATALPMARSAVIVSRAEHDALAARVQVLEDLLTALAPPEKPQKKGK